MSILESTIERSDFPAEAMKLHEITIEDTNGNVPLLPADQEFSDLPDAEFPGLFRN